MPLLLAILLSVFFIVYFAKKRWYAAALCYALGVMVLATFVLFTQEIPYVSDGIRVLMGARRFELVFRFLSLYTATAYEPFMAVELLLLVSTIIVVLSTAETIVAFCHSKRNGEYKKAMRAKIMLHTPNVHVGYEEKIYLSYCSMLC